jgi:hypothetical protein
MHPLLVFAGTCGPQIASWLLGHATELGQAYARLHHPINASLTDPNASLDRIGSALVAQQNGQTEVIGLLHQHTANLDRITTAVEGIGMSQRSLSQGIGLLSSLSMVGLGLSILTQVHIAFQFAAMTRRINSIDCRIRAIQDLLVQEQRARLSNGLHALQLAEDVAHNDPSAGREFTFAARDDLSGSRASYTQQLIDQLAKHSSSDHPYLWMLSRHLTTATLGETACHLRLIQPEQAVQVLNLGLNVLQQHASVVFNRTIAEQPTQYLMPAMREHGATLEALAELFRQANHAGVRTDTTRMTTEETFEFLRDRMGEAKNPKFGRAKKIQLLRSQFIEASAAIEEVNRLRGLALTIEQCRRSRQNYQELSKQILKGIEAIHPTDGTCFAVFPSFGAA